MIKLNKIKYFVFLVAIFALLVAPNFVSAQTPEEEQMIDFIESNNQAGLSSLATQRTCSLNVNNFGDVICKLGELLNSLLPILLSLGVVYFVWGVVQYMIGSDEEAKKKGRDRIIFGIIGLVVIVGLWGLVNLVVNTFGLGQNIRVVNPATLITNLDSSGSCAFGGANQKFQDLLRYITCIISGSVIPLIFTLALASFVWGVVQFVILGAGEEAKREQGRQFMIWGIISLAVMVSIWGLVKILGNTFSIKTDFVPQVRGR